MENQQGWEGRPEAGESFGIAPELVERALSHVVSKIGSVAAVLHLASDVRSRLTAEGKIKKAVSAPDRCYLAIDSSYTSPPLELVGGYLGLIFVVSVMYGKTCNPTASGVELSAYVTYDPTRDITRVEARRFERERAVEMLRKKSDGEASFDVLIMDGEVVPRLSPRVLSGAGEESELARRLARLTDAMVLLAERTGTPVVGVLKRSYSRDALAVLGHFIDVSLSDRAFMTYVLEPGEFVTVGDYVSIASAYQDLVLKYGEAFPRDVSPAKYRLAWFKWMLRHSSVAARMRMAFYRPRTSWGDTAVKIEYDTTEVDEDELVSSLVSASEATGFPAPVDYADSLSQIPSDVRFAVYQLALQRISEASPEIAQRLFALANPQKLNTIGLRT